MKFRLVENSAPVDQEAIPPKEAGTDFERFQMMLRSGQIKPVNSEMTTMGDVAQQFQKGLVQGAGGVISTPAYVGRYLVEQARRGIDNLMGVDPEETNRKSAEINARFEQSLFDPVRVGNAISGSTGIGEAKTTAGDYANTVGQFLPGVLMGRPTQSAMRNPSASLAPLATSATSAAVGSETGGKYAETNWPEAEPYFRLGGALAGGVTPDIVKSLLSPNQLSRSRQSLIDALKKEGVQTTAGQKTGGKMLRNIESELGGGKTVEIMETQGRQFTKAAAKKAGINASELTPAVMAKAFDDIGGEFDNLASVTQVPLDAKLQNDLLSVVDDYKSVSGQPAAAAEDIMNRIAVLAGNNGGVIDGKAYKDVSSVIAKLQRSSGADAALKDALVGIRNSLDDAVERNLYGKLLDQWRDVRSRYRNMIVLEKALLGAGSQTAEGILSPSQLRNATIQKQGGRNYVTGKGDFSTLARAGEAIMKPLPDSGTAGRQAARNLGTGILTAAGATAGGMSGNPLATLIGALIGSATPYAAGRAIMSRPVQAYLANQLMRGGRQIPVTQKALVSGAGANVGVMNNRK